MENIDFEDYAEKYNKRCCKRYDEVFKIIQLYYNGNNLLEIGGFPYGFTRKLLHEGFNVISLDKEPNKVETKGLDVRKCDIEINNFPVKKESFDVGLMSEVLEHLGKNPLHTFREVHKALKDKGIFIVATPNLYSIGTTYKHFFMDSSKDPYRVFNLYEKQGYLGHIRKYSVAQISYMLEKTGFKVLESFYVDYKKEKNLKSIIYTLFPKLRHHIIVVAIKNE